VIHWRSMGWGRLCFGTKYSFSNRLLISSLLCKLALFDNVDLRPCYRTRDRDFAGHSNALISSGKFDSADVL